MRKVLVLNPADNIAICLEDMPAGVVIDQDNLKLTIMQKIPRGHKVASKAVTKGDGIIKYGERMGHATKDISIGEHVHTHNVLGDRLSTEST
ncbi:MAG: UxaA family hydrolase [Actinobacteria bacterium]|nr:UxaA family hydrolase [Actinomycetota bacterium]